MDNRESNQIRKTSSTKSEDSKNLIEILEIKKLSRLLEQFYSATGLSNFILDLKGNILHEVGWRSDTFSDKRLKENEEYSIYICQDGMVEVATPIIIDGVHVANLFIGQFFFEKPDKDFFIKQAEDLGFDKEKHMKALEECQVYNKETILRYLDFFSGLIKIISDAALKTIKNKDQNEENDKRAAELNLANKELAFQNEEKDKRAAELIIANKELVFQTGEKADRAAELEIADKELAFQIEEKADRAAELIIANKELAFQNEEKDKRAGELILANKELAFQNEEKDKRAAELILANKELAFQNEEKDKRAAELVLANRELVFQTGEKADRAAELEIADKELAFQIEEKADRAAELIIANKELVFQTGEKADRAAELVIADEELAFQTGEKADRAAELIIANKELAFQNKEKEKRAVELLIANKELVIQKEKIEDLNEQLEDRVRQRTAQLESANKELESLSYSISHDLKAPLRHIIGYDALLVKKYINLLPDEGRQYLENISNATINMGELIDGLLRFSKTGRIEMNQDMLNMNDIINAYIQPIMEEDIEHRIVFNINSMPLAFGDLEMIKSVWNNLIDNAVKFTKKNELAKITIGAEQTENELIYYIKDNGAGFDMSYASKLFTVFQRLHSREDYEGTGIGLATVQRVITRHGGKIWAEAKVGEGATFYFTLMKRKKGE